MMPDESERIGVNFWFAETDRLESESKAPIQRFGRITKQPDAAIDCLDCRESKPLGKIIQATNLYRVQLIKCSYLETEASVVVSHKEFRAV